MRCFVALDLPKALYPALKALQSEIGCHGAFSFPRQFHISLSFLDEVEVEDLDEIIARLSEVSFDPFRFRLAEAGMFGWRVVWLGIEPEEAVVQLAEDVKRALGDGDTRFHPHVTLARVRRLKDRGWQLDPPDGEVEVDCFKLFKSTLGSEGAVHEVLAEFMGD